MANPERNGGHLARAGLNLARQNQLRSILDPLPWSSRSSRADCELVCFGEAVTRDPFFLIGREPRPDFTFADLFGKRVATVSEVPTPWLCLQEDLRRAGLDPDALPRTADRTMADNAAALRRGEFDVVQLFQPFAEELIASGDGHLWYAAASRGPCSYTSFYARRGVLAGRRDELKKIVRAFIGRRNGFTPALPRHWPMWYSCSFHPSRRPCCAPRSRATEHSASGAVTRSCRAPGMSA